MHNYIDSGALTASQNASNISVIHEGAEHDFYSHFFSATDLDDGAYATAATLTGPAAQSDVWHWVLANAVRSGVQGYVRRHLEWKNGFFKIVIYYNSTATGGDIVWRYGVSPHVPGTAFAITHNQEAVAAPASTSGVYMQEFNNATLSGSSGVNHSNPSVMVTVSRVGNDASDTNTGDVNLYGIELIYREARSRVGGGVSR